MPHTTPSQATSAQSLGLDELAQRCKQETSAYLAQRANDPRFCFELFRRAIVHRDQLAWESLCGQYEPLVTRWVRRHAAFASTGEEAQDFVNLAFAKMWAALTPDKFRFPNLSHILRYLQMCVSSVITDAVRANERAGIDVHAGELEDELQHGSQSVERVVFDRAQRQALWQEIDARMHTEQERLVIYASFVLGLKPREIVDSYADKFCDVNEVYRAKENVLARLRRDQGLQELFGPRPD